MVVNCVYYFTRKYSLTLHEQQITPDVLSIQPESTQSTSLVLTKGGLHREAAAAMTDNG